MTEFLSPGVFTEEVRSGETAILGVSTSNFASVGWTPRGIEDKPILCTSLADYFRKLGGYWKNGDMAMAATAFYKNGGALGYFVRVCPDDAVKATVDESTLWTYDAISRGAWGNVVRVVVRGNQNNYDHATAAYSKYDVEVQEESANGAGDFAVVETFEAVDLSDADAADYFPDVVNDDETGSALIRVKKLSGGVPAALLSTGYTAESIGTGDGSTTSFTDTLAHTGVAKFSVKVKVAGVVAAQDNGRGKLTLVGSVFSAVSGALDYATGDIAIAFTPAPANSAAITVDYYVAGADEVSQDLAGGVDGTAVTRANVTDPALQVDKKGLYALDSIEEILNIGLADFSGDAVVALDLIAYCEGRQDAFAILDTKRGIDTLDAKNYRQVTLNSLSSWGALYYPGVKVADPLKNGRTRVMSPVGHVAGVYARTDSTRNVGKAPAGTVDGALNFCLGLERQMDMGDRNVLYPVNVNCLIDTPATGRAVWGARTLEISGDFNLVQVRRLFMFLRKSTFLSTQDLVFEPIGTELFSLVGLRMNSFMNRLAGEGYFASRVPAEAFLITVDETNNTPATIAARQLITDILVAPQTPAEFVRFRFKRSLTKLG